MRIFERRPLLSDDPVMKKDDPVMKKLDAAEAKLPQVHQLTRETIPYVELPGSPVPKQVALLREYLGSPTYAKKLTLMETLKKQAALGELSETELHVEGGMTNEELTDLKIHHKVDIEQICREHAPADVLAHQASL